MSSYPFTQPSSLVELLNSQQDSISSYPCVALGSSQPPVFTSQASQGDASFDEDSHKERTARRQWTPVEDIILISSWLNTSKDPVVGNEQKSGTFWERISNYFAASQKPSGTVNREAIQCKQRWQKINEAVCKFSGCYDAATRARTSGQNENDILKMAHEIYFNDNKKKFTMEHAWKELRFDQKWCDQTSAKKEGSCKRPRFEDGGQSHNINAEPIDVETAKRPAGVKAAKAKGKSPTVDPIVFSQFQNMLQMNEKDMVTRERLLRMSMLDNLLAKKEPLTESEEVLKQNLITELI
ncbi:glutathione S-transferase T3-like isoform X2 [Eutrema salsugineum]|uniref:glutathione S-transferase T3-like isoform X2 n=1 Tax=Eutrema salsugineum TaxID=72664 RepID=UPI000CED1D7A|nr:glutathione S-transferase T3-like isoform X2 [Eutrema salsugineum]XP_024004315.1 glutathione S-transferase T3-like isoform X2 [Eutrema salsugineum]